jgi:hypothetical protein
MSYNGLEEYRDSAGVDMSFDIYDNGLSLGVYVLYFVVTLFLVRQVDKCGIFDELVDRLAKSAEIQYLIQKHEVEARREMKRKALGGDASSRIGAALFANDEQDNHSDIDDSIHHMEEATARFPEQGGEEGENFDAGFLFELSNPMRPHVYFNTRANLRPWMCRCCRSGCKSSWLTDLVFYLLNNSQLISMMGCCKDHPFSREERRLAYLLQQTLAFAIASVVTTMQFDTMTVELKGYEVELNENRQKILLNVFVISPFILMIYNAIYLLFSCPCLKIHCGWRCLIWLRHFVETFSHHIARTVCFIVASLCILWVSVFEPDTSFSRLVTFALQVQVVSAVMDMLRCLLLFFPVCIRLSLCGIPLINLGRWLGDMRASKTKRYGTKPPVHMAFMGISLTLCWWSFSTAKVAIAPAPTEPEDIAPSIVPSRSGALRSVHITGSSLPTHSQRFSFARRPTIISKEDADRLADEKVQQEVHMLLLKVIRRVQSEAEEENKRG